MNRLSLETCIALKEAGFPQNVEGKILCPNLSELIEACGDGFKQLIKSDTGFSALPPIRSDLTYICEDFPTPEEAIANLFLKIKHPKMIRNWGGQYKDMIAAFKKYEVPLDGIPKFEDLKINEVLNKLQHIVKPTLLLVPPVSRQELIKLFDKQREKSDSPSCVFEYDNDSLFGEDSKEWRVMIVEGAREIEETKPGNAKEQSLAWQLEADSREIGLINDAQTYIALQMISRHQNTLIDGKKFTYLRTNLDFISFAYFNTDHRWMVFSNCYLNSICSNLCGRYSVEVEF